MNSIKICRFFYCILLYVFSISSLESKERPLHSDVHFNNFQPNRIKLLHSNSKRGIAKKQKPNILFFIVDEQRALTGYESEELKEWLRKNLVFQTMLAKKGVVFHNHYTNTNACCPARAVLHTGQYPNVTGVTQTPGAAKFSTSPEMTWLKPFTVPTIGNYLRKAGYQSILKGKWHVSNASIALPDGSLLTTFDVKGRPIPELYEFYLKQNVLNDFGYDGWIGPEPEGSSPLNSGSSIDKPANGRDPTCTLQVLDQLDKLAKSKEPWFLIASYVNPHDIAQYGVENQAPNTGWSFQIDKTLPKKLFKDEFQLSLNESLVTKPPAQMDYRDSYSVVFQAILDIDRYQRYYYTIQKKVDMEMLKVWNKLISDPMYENTIIIFTADHGDLLASHGKMFQKWFQAYQESIHIPLIISSPLIGSQHADVYQLTSHVDILPTLLDFVHANPEKLRKELGKTFSLNLPLSGKSLLPLMRHPDKKKSRPVYYYTEDNPTSGPHQVDGICQPYEAVKEPASVEAILTYIDGDLWKFTHYYNPTGNCGNVQGVKNELYNVSQDPMELNSLFQNPNYAQIQQRLTRLLARHAARFRIIPNEKKGQEGGEG